MPSPFPGMNPYFEHPEFWPEVYHWLVTLIAESLVSQLRPKYRVAVEKRVYQSIGEENLLVGIPDVVVGPRAESGVAVSAPPAKP